jgi:hypothetical protein
MVKVLKQLMKLLGVARNERVVVPVVIRIQANKKLFN